MGCGASAQAAPAGTAPPTTKGVPDNGLPKGILLDKSGKGKYDMKALFAQFDADGDGKLDIYEIARAFRAMGLPKRDGTKMDMDHVRANRWARARCVVISRRSLLTFARSTTRGQAMFKSFDTNGDGYVSMEELDAGLKPKTRQGCSGGFL